MKKEKKKVRKVCVFCGAKLYLEKLRWINFKDGGQYACINNDLCVLKMSYNKKKNK